MINKDLTQEEKIDFLRVIRTRNIGPISFLYLLETYKSIDKVIKYLESKINCLHSKEDALLEFRKIKNFGADLIAFCEPGYPNFLKEIRDAPPLICIKGNKNLLKNNRMFGIAGSRNCSMQSQSLTKRIAGELGEFGYTVVSGLARGIDTNAHIGSLNTGTIAVLANGIDHVYPQENQKLYDQISNQGVLISEVAFGTRPSAHLFPARNRIIAGMSWGVLISEAGLKSGSLITAQFALDNGREIFAIPGCPLDPRSRGTNKLIKQGAHLTEFVYDINNLFENFKLKEPVEKYSSAIKYDFNEDEITDKKSYLLSLVSFLPTSIEILISKSNLPVSIVKSLLVQLEIENKIKHLWGNKVILNK